MKIVVLILRLLLGLVFLVFGLNAFLQFLNGPIPGGLAGADWNHRSISVPGEIPTFLRLASICRPLVIRRPCSRLT